MGTLLLPEVDSNGALTGEQVFWCPGCRCAHAIDKKWIVSGEDGSLTIRPSVVNQFGDTACHLLITNSMIEFLPDSTHWLAGKTVPMEAI